MLPEGKAGTVSAGQRGALVIGQADPIELRQRRLLAAQQRIYLEVAPDSEVIIEPAGKRDGELRMEPGRGTAPAYCLNEFEVRFSDFIAEMPFEGGHVALRARQLQPLDGSFAEAPRHLSGIDPASAIEAHKLAAVAERNDVVHGATSALDA